jgi:DNA-binding CsgD family transcriptional regulator/tetratricopeptide (TPR) repeat protein
MSRGTLGPAPSELLERDSEIERLEAALLAAATGHGAMVAIAGPAGAGKTALLEVARARALALGADVRIARATELERDFAFGGARQLLAASAAVAALDGAVRAIAPVLAAGATVLEPPPPFAVLDGLTAHLGSLSSDRTVVLLIDDAHWLDAPTLRWLDYLGGRLGELRVLVVATVRESAIRQLGTPLSRVLGDSRLEMWSLAPLSEAAIAALISRRLGEPADPALVGGCARATAGNAFAVCEVIAALEPDDADPAQALAHLPRRVPATIARSIRARLSRLDPDAVTFARALAVLGDGAPIHDVATLSRLSGERAGAMADQLATADLLLAARPLAFTHPLVRSAIEEDLAPGARARWHADSAAILVAHGGDPEAIAAHLLRSDAAGDALTVGRLRAAATLALRRGAPDVAVTYLRRAHGEPPPGAERVAVLHELGRAELLAGAPAGVGHLEAALSETDDPLIRARIGVDLFDGMSFAGRWRDAVGLLRGLRDDAVGDHEPRTALALEIRLALDLIERDSGSEAELLTLEASARHVPGAQVLLLLLALVLALRSERCDEVPGLVEEGLQGERFLSEYSADSMLAVHALDALVFVDALPRAEALADAVCADARRRGLVLGAVAGATHRGLVRLRAGRLADAEHDLREALRNALEHELHFTLPFIVAYLAETLTARGATEDAAAVLASLPETSPEFNNAAAATLLVARGAVRLARGERHAAVNDLRAGGERLTEMGAGNPIVAPWRSTLALALGPDAHDEAVALIAEELRLARRTGLARAVGVALCAEASLSSGDAAIAILEQAVTVLAASPAVLPYARALADLGAALRRGGRVTEARVRLRAALDHASHCGAEGLAAAVMTELHIAGARPRAPWLTGVEALTPSELRVARLAATGISNLEIATELVITTKTVKHHLSAVYRKLQITTRRELDAGRLNRGPAPRAS